MNEYVALAASEQCAFLLVTNVLSHFSSAVAGLRATLSRFLEGRYINIQNK